MTFEKRRIPSMDMNPVVDLGPAFYQLAHAQVLDMDRCFAVVFCVFLVNPFLHYFELWVVGLDTCVKQFIGENLYLPRKNIS